MTLPEISLVTPCFNGEKFLDAFFQSILNQTYKNYELIFIDDGSTDKTKQIALKWIEVFRNSGISAYYFYQKNAGQAKAINLALTKVKGRFFCWPDSDDELHEHFFESAINEFKSNEYNIVRTYACVVNEAEPDNILYNIGKPKNNTEYIFDDLITEKTYCTCGCYMVRMSTMRDCIPNLKIWDDTRGGQNWQILLPITLKHQVKNFDSAPYKYYIHKESHSRQAIDELFYYRIKKLNEHKRIIMNVVKDLNVDQNYYMGLISKKYNNAILKASLKEGELIKYLDYISDMDKQDITYLHIFVGTLIRWKLINSNSFNFLKKIWVWIKND